MKSKKVFLVMLAVIGLLIVATIGIVVLGDVFLHKQSSKLVALKLDNQVVEAQQLALNKAKADILKYSELDSISKQIVPQEKDQARTTREIISLANQSDILLEKFEFPTSNLGIAAPKVTKTEDSKTTSTATAIPATTLSQVKPVEGISGLFQLDIVINSAATRPTTYENLIKFLERLEQNRRTAHVIEISINPSTAATNRYDFSLTVRVYIKP